MKDIKQLTDGLVTIRPYRTDDVEGLYEAVRESLEDLSPWMPWCRPDYSIEESSCWVEGCPDSWQNGTEYSFVISCANEGIFLGGCGLNQIDSDVGAANLGYWVRSSQARRGIATSAALLTALFGFEELGLTRVEIVPDVENIASQRVAEKTGASREGVFRARFPGHNMFYDGVMYFLRKENLSDQPHHHQTYGVEKP